MPYNPSSDFVGLWSAVSGGVQKAQMPGLDFVIEALGRAGLLRLSTSATAPIANQLTTAWFRPSNPSFQSEGTLFLWDKSLNMYVPATPELFLAMLGGNPGSGSGSGSGGSSGIEEAPNDGVQYGRQSLAWTPVAGSAVIPPDGGGGSTDMATVSPTPPPSPTTGLQWWDGSTMWVWNGTAWQAVGGGTSTLVLAIPQPNPITMGPAGWQIMAYTAAPQIDIMTGWDPVTHKYTPKKPGYYAFSVRGQPGANGGFAVLKNDDGIFDTSSDIALSISYVATAGWLNADGFVQMNGTTDYIRAFGYAGAAGAVFSGFGANPALSVLRLP